MATPHVAGAFAALREEEPAAGVGTLFAKLRDTGRAIFDARSGGLYTKRRIRIGNALSSFGEIQFQSPAFSAAEGDVTATITVIRQLTTGPATVKFATSDGSAIAGTHYRAASGTLTFNAGESSKTFTIGLIHDTRAGPDRTVNLKLSSPTGAVLGSPAAAVLTITNIDNAGTIAPGSATYSVAENAGTAPITLVRTGTNLASGVTVPFSTVNLTAVAPADYTAKTGTVTFAAGQTSAAFNGAIVDDRLLQGDRTFRVLLGTPAGGGVLGSPATADVTILENDTAGTIQFTAPTYSVGEAATSATIKVTRTGPNLAGGVQVRYAATAGTATRGSDFTAVSGTLTFAAGVTSMSFAVPILDDGAIEAAETVNLALALPAGSSATLGTPSTALLTIQDNDAPLIQFALAAQSVTEGGTASVVVTRARQLAMTVSADYQVTGGTATGGGVDYTLASGTVTFPAGVTSRTIPIKTVDDTLVEGPETIVIALQNPSAPAVLGPRSSTTVTILDNEQVIAFSRPVYNATEGNVSLAVPIVRTGPTPGGVTVTCTVGGGSAVAGTDYTAVTRVLTFAAGSRSVNCLVPLLDDTVIDGTKTLDLALSLPAGSPAHLGAQSTAVVNIADNDDPGTFKFAAATFNASEPAGATPALATITVIRTIPAGKAAAANITVDYATADGTATAGEDYAATAGTLTFGAGQLARSFTVPILHDTRVEGGETVLLTLSAPSAGVLGSPNPATLTIKDNDVGGTIKFAASAYGIGENRGQVTLTVLRSGGAASDVTVQYATSDHSAHAGTDYTADTGTLTFGAGETSKTITVTVLDNAVADGNRAFKVTLSTPGGGGVLGSPVTTLVTILDDEVGVRFSRADYAIGEGGVSAVITVLRTGPRNAPVTVQYATSDGTATAGLDYGARSGTLTIPAGAASTTFAVPIREDTLAESPETVNLTLSSPSGALLGSPTTATLTINDNDNGGVIAFAVATAAVNEGKSITLTVKRTGTNLASNVTVDYTVSGSATSGSDFTIAAGPITFGAAQTTKTIVVPVIEDGLIEGHETLVVTLTNPTGGGTLGSPASVTVTLRDAAQVRFLNNLVLCGNGCVSFVARLKTGQGRTWDSLSGTPSPYKPVPEPQLTNLVVTALGYGISVSFAGSFTIVPSQRYLIVLTVNSAGSPILLLSNEGPLGAPAVTDPDAALANPDAAPFTLMPDQPVQLAPGGRLQRFRTR
jgi:hypothetical protein